MTSELEELAMRIVALPIEQRLALEERVRALGRRVRRVSERLSGRTDANKLTQLMAGGSVYNQHGEPVGFIAKFKLDTVHGGLTGSRIEATMTVVQR